MVGVHGRVLMVVQRRGDELVLVLMGWQLGVGRRHELLLQVLLFLLLILLLALLLCLLSYPSDSLSHRWLLMLLHCHLAAAILLLQPLLYPVTSSLLLGGGRCCHHLVVVVWIGTTLL